MKRIITLLLSLILMVSFSNFNASATNKNVFTPQIVNFTVTPINDEETFSDSAKASGLIYQYGLSLSRSGTLLNITGTTQCVTGVVKSGFKDLMVQRRKTSSDSWKDYFDIGDIFADAIGANLDMNVSVASGYQYRVKCKHYAKKNILTVETVSNVSNIATTP